MVNQIVLDNKIKFIVALIILALSVVSNDVFQIGMVCIKTELLFSHNL